MDFKEIKAHTNDIVSKLDHKCLNEIEPFNKINPSSENLAKYIFDKLEKKINTDDIKVSKVTVYESLNSSASYFKEG